MTDFRPKTVDTLLEAVSHHRRRYVVALLSETQTMTVENLVSELIAIERRAVDGSTPSPQHVHVSLVHTHLPVLADANVIDYDPRSGTVRRRDLEAPIWPLLENILASDDGAIYPEAVDTSTETTIGPEKE